MNSDLIAQLRDCCTDQTAFEQLQHLLQQLDPSAQAKRYHTLFRVVAKIRETLDLQTIFKVTATEVRQLLKADRVAMFRFYPNAGYNDGEFVSEDVLPAYDSAMAARIHDHCFGEQYAIHYAKGRIQAVADIHNAGLKDCHVEVLSRFQIRANLIVPLLQGDRLWGLLCIHQCAEPRHWQPDEIEFVQHIAEQLGVALYQAELLEQVQYQAEQQKILFQVVGKIRESLSLNDIFTTAAREVWALLKADRVGIFRFDPDSGYDDGEFVSEQVTEGYASALAAKIHDHCFGEQYSEQYFHGRIQAVDDIYSAGLKDCHIEVLSRFQIRANLIVPLLQGNHLWGLLCIHQCAEPRHWQPLEIEFVKQIATQLGIALYQAELLEQTQQQAQQLMDALDTLKRTQTQLIQSEKMSSLGQLVAGVAHEINNPVNFIYGNLTHATQYAEDLLELLETYQVELAQPSDDLRDRLDEVDIEFLREDFPKILSSMQLGADRIRQIVLSLRNFSRLDEAAMKPVNIHDGIDSTLMILQYRLKPRVQNRGIRVVKEYGDLPPVECYASQLNQVFMNILSNAIDALEEQEDTEDTIPLTQVQQITIRTEFVEPVEGGVPYARIQIEDNGMGIPQALLPRLFDPFFTTKPVGKGTGLGLSISYQIVVERHGGALRCTSQPGEGTTFWIEVPIRQPQQTAIAPLVLQR